MTRVAIVSAVYGGYDAPHPLPAQVGVENVAWLYTDDEDLAKSPPAGWNGAWMPRPGVDPRLAAKSPKAIPNRYVPMAAQVIIWIDGHVEVTSPTFARSLVDDLGPAEWGMFRHTHTHSLTEELALSHVTGKYDDARIDAQVADYLAAGMPDDYGVWMTGLFVRRNTPTMHELGRRWMTNMQHWSVQDQLSLPFVAWGLGLKPVDLPFEGWWRGDRFMLHKHADGTG